MTKSRFHKKHGIVRSAIKEDILFFGIPALTVFATVLIFCAAAGAEAGLTNFWGTVGGLIIHPRNLLTFPMHARVGLAIIMIGFAIMIVGQVTLYRNYSGTVIIREGHQLVTHGIYRFTRNPMYLGLIFVVIGFPTYVASLPGLVTLLLMIPLILNRIRLEEKLLSEEFQEAF